MRRVAAIEEVHKRSHGSAAAFHHSPYSLTIGEGLIMIKTGHRDRTGGATVQRPSAIQSRTLESAVYCVDTSAVATVFDLPSLDSPWIALSTSSNHEMACDFRDPMRLCDLFLRRSDPHCGEARGHNYGARCALCPVDESATKAMRSAKTCPIFLTSTRLHRTQRPVSISRDRKPGT